MKKNVIIFCVLLFLAIVPAGLSFHFMGDEEDEAKPFEAKMVEPTLVAEPIEMPEPIEVVKSVEVVKPVEVAKAIEEKKKKRKVASNKVVPVFKGYENPRYQQYDEQIRQFCEDFNKNPRAWAGATTAQCTGITSITPAQIKAHIIQETGGGDLKSRTAWKYDPLQVNVPGDWSPYKKYLGLRKPRRRNEGSASQNLKAGLMLLVRKGFGVSGQPAANRPSGTFDGWSHALQRYNGRSDKTASGELYRVAYSKRIRSRAENPTVNVPIQIPTK